MSARRSPWSATVRLELERAVIAQWLERALAPEAAREVPRAHATLRRRGPRIELQLQASDAGAMRAALNTYLGWIALSLATATAAEETHPAPPRGEALISRPR